MIHRHGLKKMKCLLLTAVVWFLLNVYLFWRFHFNEDPQHQVQDQPTREHLSIDAANSNFEGHKSMTRSNKSEHVFKTILAWTGFNGPKKVWRKVFIRLLSNECDENRCQLVLDRDDVPSADAVLFNIHDLLKRKPYSKKKEADFKPITRKEEQIYIFFSMEAPNWSVYHNVQWESYQNFFNWTMTYRLDSDIVVQYGKVLRKGSNDKSKENHFVTDEELLNRKMAIWMVSHCKTSSERESFVQDLQKYMDVDIYGACGNLKCGNPAFTYSSKMLESDPCNNVSRKYAFYLALENSLCEDYVTEKLYRSLKLGIVPVVFGGANYSIFSPRGSYIEANAFASVSHLADHMKMVAKNASLYNEYLKWTKYYEVEIGSPYKPFICDLCKKLHDPSFNRASKSYPNIKDWYVQGAKCYKYKRLREEAKSELFWHKVLL